MKILIRLCALCLVLGLCSLLFHVSCSSFCWKVCWAQCETWQDTRQNIPTVSPVVHLTGYSRVPDGQLLSRGRCQQCAVVSSSGQMLGSRKGQEIDSAECVLRMNQAPTGGFEKDVGSRSTVRVVSHTSVPLLVRNSTYFFQQSPDTLYIIWGPQKVLNHEKGIIYRMLLKVRAMYPRVQLYTLTEAMMARCDSIFKNETGKDRMKSGSFLSTGWFTMILAIEMCEKISVYGMVSENYCREKSQQSVPYHYFEKGKMSECSMYLVHERAPRGGHRFITEKAVFSRYRVQKNLKDDKDKSSVVRGHVVIAQSYSSSKEEELEATLPVLGRAGNSIGCCGHVVMDTKNRLHCILCIFMRRNFGCKQTVFSLLCNKAEKETA